MKNLGIGGTSASNGLRYCINYSLGIKLNCNLYTERIIDYCKSRKLVGGGFHITNPPH